MYLYKEEKIIKHGCWWKRSRCWVVAACCWLVLIGKTYLMNDLPHPIDRTLSQRPCSKCWQHLATDTSQDKKNPLQIFALGGFLVEVQDVCLSWFAEDWRQHGTMTTTGTMSWTAGNSKGNCKNWQNIVAKRSFVGCKFGPFKKITRSGRGSHLGNITPVWCFGPIDFGFAAGVHGPSWRTHGQSEQDRKVGYHQKVTAHYRTSLLALQATVLFVWVAGYMPDLAFTLWV